MEEQIFAKGDVPVTKTLVRIGSVSYPVNGIGSVLVKPRTVSLGVLVLAVILALVGLSAFAQTDGVVGVILLLAIAAAFCWYAFSRPDVLVLRTASGDQNALSSKIGELMNSVKTAIEVAVAQRG